VEVDGVGAVGGDFVDIEIERALGGDDEALDAGFLERFAAGDAENVLIAIAMAAELEPAAELAMMMQQDPGAIGIDDKGAAGEVGGEGGALEAARGAVKQGKHAVAGGLFIAPPGEIHPGQQRAQLPASHGTPLRCPAHRQFVPFEPNPVEFLHQPVRVVVGYIHEALAREEMDGADGGFR
jgi:hypothetical protein